ncbi:MAG TPA: response regulator transcription factor [Chloroflexota bacterium]|nr:response regulator transcription factor [Chloroflexota bacterium]
MADDHALRRALIIESDDDYASLMSSLLHREGWEFQRERDPLAGLERLTGGTSDQFDVILVNTPAEPDNGGRSALSALRGASDAPLIALCTEDASEERLEQGITQAVELADYNLVKPFSPRRFRAAVRAVARRGRVEASPSPPAEVRVGGVTMSYGRLEVVVDGRRVELSPREFALLHLLLANPGTVFTRDELARLAWGWKESAESRAVDNTVQRLRRKIEGNPKRPRYLLTDRGTGYSFAAQSAS